MIRSKLLSLNRTCPKTRTYVIGGRGAAEVLLQLPAVRGEMLSHTIKKDTETQGNDVMVIMVNVIYMWSRAVQTTPRVGIKVSLIQSLSLPYLPIRLVVATRI